MRTRTTHDEPHTNPTKEPVMRRLTTLLSLVALPAVLAGCGDFDIGNLNNPELEPFEQNPTVASIRAGVQGLQIGMRDGIDASTGYVAHLGILGRESYTLDGADPRFVDEMVGGDLNPGSGAFGGSNWFARYQNLKGGDLVLGALERINDADLPQDDKAAIRGFTKTIMALDYLLVVNTRADNGIVWEIVDGAESAPAPFVSDDEALANIAGLLDEAMADLQGAGGSFPFTLAPGLSSFASPADFMGFNRALAARVAVYRGDYGRARAALDASFMDPEGDLYAGAYYNYSSDAGDNENTLATDADILAHPAIRDEAGRQADGSLDARVQRKTRTRSVRSQAGLSTDLDFTHYPSGDAPIPIIRNEELLLLEAEVRWFTGDPEGAWAMLNDVRTRSGGLQPLDDLPVSERAFVSALLRERRYSLMFEGGHRWIDHRRFDRLDEIEVDRAGDVVPEAFPIPRSECLVRGQASPCRV